MLNVDRVWARASQRPEYRGKGLSQYTTQVIVAQFTLQPTQISGQTSVLFPAGAVILGIQAKFIPTAQPGTSILMDGMDMFAFSLDYQATNRSIVGTSRAIGSTVFGNENDQFPGKELYIPTNGSLLYTVENLTSSTIFGTFSHHCLVPSAIG
jgi:hypothetical protein